MDKFEPMVSHTKFEVRRMRRDAFEEAWKNDELHEMYDRCKGYRAEVIDAAAIVEIQLNKVLCDAMIGVDELLRGQFEGLILSTGAFSFFAKWKLLKDLMNSKSPWWTRVSREYSKANLTALRELIEYRNAFAHGDIFVDAEHMRTMLTYFKDGKQQVVLNEEYLVNILNLARTSFEWLESFCVKGGEF